LEHDLLSSRPTKRTRRASCGRIVSALKQFSLVTEEGSNDSRQIRLSQLSLEMFNSEPQSERWLQLARTAALSPKIHGELWDKYEGHLPSDANLRRYLVFERKPFPFNKTYVDDFIGQFKSTIAFAKLSSDDKIVDERRDDPEKNNKKGKDVAAVAPQDATDVVVRDFPIPLISGGLAVVKVPVPMSEEDFQQLTGTLTAWKSALVRKAKRQAATQTEADDPEESDRQRKKELYEEFDHEPPEDE
jgi:hypothetical protein